MNSQSQMTDQQSNAPLVSIIMNCYNSDKYLREAIDSVYAQTYTNWEIIFWDNVSTDNSAAIAQSYQDGRLRYFRGETNVPLGHARNFAIEKSYGELIAFLDCDDLWMPEKLEKQAPLFLADNEVGLVYSDTYFFNEDGFQKQLYAKKTPYRGHCFSDLLNDYLISLETAIVRKSALDSLDHWFDVNFNMIEEYDLFVRIGLDWKIDFSPEVLAKWRVHGESLSWKAPGLFVQETRDMLVKLETMPKIHKEYVADMELAWYRLKFSEAKILWKNGDGSTARNIILKSRHRNLKPYMFWVLSFFPFNIIESIYRYMLGSVTPTEVSKSNKKTS
jgi:glycosyltransferase involved in cell wall biosynthesis